MIQTIPAAVMDRHSDWFQSRAHQCLGGL